MTAKRLRVITAVISMGLALAVGWSVGTGNFIVPIVAVVVASGLVYVLRRSTRDVTRDERTNLLYDKAAGATIKFCVPLVALLAIILFVLRQNLSAEMVAAAYVLAYVSCGLLLVHLAFYSYYSRKY